MLFLNDLGVLDHGDAAAFRDFALHGDAFAAIFGEFIVDWLVFANDEVGFAIAHDADRATSFDALGPASLAMFLADRVMVDIAHHIDYFAGDRFTSGCVQTFFAVLVFFRKSERRERKRGNERGGDRDLQNIWIVRG